MPPQPMPGPREGELVEGTATVEMHAITDCGGRAILEQACASADRAAECVAIIAEQSAVISTKHGLKDHPLLRHETAARGQLIDIFKRP